MKFGFLIVAAIVSAMVALAVPTQSRKPIIVPATVIDQKSWIADELLIRWATDRQWPLDDRIVRRYAPSNGDWHQAPLALSRMQALLLGYELDGLRYTAPEQVLTTLYTVTITSSNASQTLQYGPTTPTRLASLLGQSAATRIAEGDVTFALTHPVLEQSWAHVATTQTTLYKPTNLHENQQQLWQQWLDTQLAMTYADTN